MRVFVGLGVAVLAVALAGCGEEVAGAAAQPTSELAEPATPSALSCPSNKFFTTEGGFLAEKPDGFPTREQAVESFLAAKIARVNGWADAGYVISEDGKVGWVLREDGTAQVRLNFLRHDGFTVYGFDACSS